MSASRSRWGLEWSGRGRVGPERLSGSSDSDAGLPSGTIGPMMPIRAVPGPAVFFAMSVGLLAKVVSKMTAALGDSYHELIAALPRQPVLGIDETGLRHCGQGHWVWCAHAPGTEGLTCFAIAPSRGSCVLNEILGTDYTGIIACDYFSAYRKYLADTQGVQMQFC